ncbi:MAG: class I SAM-dependent methyltransferase [Spirochaetes bacterium]|nr:class I SAM-dependent methyltransferase [Spirochaetota bacterium]
MPKINAFENFTEEYEQWFTENNILYKSELAAIKDFIPQNKFGCEIGVGTGKFAIPLKIEVGVDPSFKMIARAKASGINVLLAAAESIPFKNETFDYAAAITSICFFDNINIALGEIYRILKKDGIIIIGFIDANSELGRAYIQKKADSKFYKDATFYSTDEIIFLLRNAGFNNFDFNQTIFKNNKNFPNRYMKGHGQGSFVVLKGIKKE